MLKETEKYTYKPLTAAEIARAIDETGLSLGQICRLLGVDYEWMRDEVLRKDNGEAPHILRVLFILLAASNNGVSLARQVTDAVIDKTDEFDVSQKHMNANRHGKPSSFTVERKGRRS